MATSGTTEHRRHLTVPPSRTRPGSRSPSGRVSPAPAPINPAASVLSFASTFSPPNPPNALESLLRETEHRCEQFEHRIARLQDILDHEFENWRTALREHDAVNDELIRLSEAVNHTATREVPQTLAKLNAESRETRGVAKQLDLMGRRVVETENKLKEGRRRMDRLERVLAEQEAGRGWLTWTNFVIGMGALILAMGLAFLMFYYSAWSPPLEATALPSEGES
ncbi:hypothetical protein CALVIDRAFT_523860 [Calocera viscosa TUFC12733]|uniref:Sensitive to high expression protein 9, mitochondrial n=1 Tax=Calocera viscosa (strain TUFC12733) TaxID=1330018 RepID=A0A167RZM6_CALVF|nr:hypothetical protein CALVIDRAFT_523860 [Calocera viscosa TUFC12733]